MENSKSTKQKISRGLTLPNYLMSELKRGYMLENDEERYAERREKVETFFMIPRETEKFFAYGFFQCADSFTFVLTFLPLRFVLACGTLLVRSIARLIRWIPQKDRLLKPAEIVDLVKGVLLISCCYGMTWFDTSVLYHLIKTQSTIKIYLIFNMLEIADRLMSAFGQDTLDALFWTATEPGGRKRHRVGGIVFHLCVSVVYVFLHASIVLLQALALNVAINASDKGLLAILISNNFVELKGSVFKKFDRINLLQISCSDIRERFHLIVLMIVVGLQTLNQYNWSEERLYILMPDCILICVTEVLVDWIKHAFVTRFNEIPIEAYRDYTTILAHDLVMCKQKYADSDHSDLVARRMGFIPLPLGVVTFRILSQCLPFHNPMSYGLLILGYAVTITFRVLNGIVMLGKASDILEDAERRRTFSESSMDGSQEHKYNKQTEDLLKTFVHSPFKSKEKPNKNITSTPNKFSSNPATTEDNHKSSSCCKGHLVTQVQPSSDHQNESNSTVISKNGILDTTLTAAASESFKSLSSSSDGCKLDVSITSDTNLDNSSSVDTPFATPTHLIKRIKGKRVRLDSGAQVQEIEPYYHYYDVQEEEEFVTSTPDAKNASNSFSLDLPVSNESAGVTPTSETSTSLPSPGPYDGSSSSMNFCHDTQGGLMANSMVNLASVGLNQGPQTPEIEDQSSLLSSSQRSSCASLSQLEDDIARDIRRRQKEASGECDAPVRPSSCPSAEFMSTSAEGETKQTAASTNSASFDSNSSSNNSSIVSTKNISSSIDSQAIAPKDVYHDSDNNEVRIVATEHELVNLTPAHKSISAPDISRLDNSDEDEEDR